MLKEQARQPTSRWNWVLWWRVDKDDVEWQASHYADLTFGDSFKGWSAIALLLSTALSCALIAINQVSAWNFLDPLLMLSLAAFIYFGHRWAMIAAMILWTLEKLSQ